MWLLFNFLYYGILLCKAGTGRVIDKKRGRTWITIAVAGVNVLLLGVLIVCVDTEMAGILSRYLVDFLRLLYAAAVVVFLQSYESADAERRGKLNLLLLFIFVSQMAFDFFAGITFGDFNSYDPKQYRLMQSWFQ